MGKPDPANPPRVLNQASMKALLTAAGWTATRGGNHVIKMVKEGHRPITLPMHKGRDYGSGLRAGILKQADL